MCIICFGVFWLQDTLLAFLILFLGGGGGGGGEGCTRTTIDSLCTLCNILFSLFLSELCLTSFRILLKRRS